MKFRMKTPDTWLRAFYVYKQQAQEIKNIAYEETEYSDIPLTDVPLKSHWKTAAGRNDQTEHGRRVSETLQSAVFDFKSSLSEGDKIVFEDSTELDYIVRRIQYFPSYTLVTIERV